MRPSLKVLLALVCLTVPDAAAQAPACLGFAFGAWSPALDWRAAGHGERPDTTRLQRAPAGRDWAVNGMATESDSVMLLFPAWWPAGVAVTLPTREPAPGDTVVGRAVALVANGQRTPPAARVRAWRVACAPNRH